MRRTGESYSSARTVLRRRNGQSSTVPAAELSDALAELSDTELVERCAAPLARLLREPDQAVRHTALRTLNEPQAALLAYWMVHAHTASSGLSTLCKVLPHRMVDPNFWQLIHSGLRHVPAQELAEILEQLRTEVRRCLIEARCSPLLDSGAALQADEFAQLIEALGGLDPTVIGDLDERYARIASATFANVARYVRTHHDAFTW
jgi:hypothetical protein